MRLADSALRSAVGLAVVLLAATAAAGCGASPATPSPTALASGPPSGPTASPAAASPTAAGSDQPVVGGPIVDPALLALLPSTIDGIRVEPAPEAAAEIVADPELGRAVEAIAVGMLVGPGSSTAEDLAIINVIRLRPGVFDDDFFRAWRDSYDGAACERAGGLAGSAETEIGGRAVHIGSCAGGAYTYHLRLDQAEMLLSITSVGEGRLGERLVGQLGE